MLPSGLLYHKNFTPAVFAEKTINNALRPDWKQNLSGYVGITTAICSAQQFKLIPCFVK